MLSSSARDGRGAPERGIDAPLGGRRI